MFEIIVEDENDRSIGFGVCSFISTRSSHPDGKQLHIYQEMGGIIPVGIPVRILDKFFIIWPVSYHGCI